MSELSPKFPPTDFSVAQKYGLSELEWQKLVKGLSRNPNEIEIALASRLWSDDCAIKRGRMFLRGVFRGAEGELANRLALKVGEFKIGFEEELNVCFEQICLLAQFDLEAGIYSGLGRCIDELSVQGGEPLGLGFVGHLGNPDGTKSREQIEKLVRSAALYSRKIGIPIVISDIFFEERYDSNPLIACVAFGVFKQSERKLTSNTGKKVILYVGSETRKEGLPFELKAPVVDPYFQELLLKAIKKGWANNQIMGCVSLGVGGLIKGLAELASSQNVGARVYLNQIPTVPEEGKPGALNPLEIALSESAQRFLIAVDSSNYRELSDVMLRYGLKALQIGEFTTGSDLELQWNHQAITFLPHKVLLQDIVEKSYQLARFPPMPKMNVPSVALGETKQVAHGILEDLWVDLLASPNVHLRSKLAQSIDHTRGRTLLSEEGSPVAVQRIMNSKQQRAIVTTVVSSPRYGRRDPYLGSVHSVAKGMRYLAAAGAMPTMAAQVLFAGDPSDYKQLSEFSEIVRGTSDACKAWYIPILTDSVRFAPASNPPIPTASVFLSGVLSDQKKSLTPIFKEKGDKVFVIGFPGEELGESQFYSTLGKSNDGVLPDINFDLERRASECLFELVQEGLLQSAHSISNGGLAIALAECSLLRERPIGFEVDLLKTNSRISSEALLFSESASRFVISFKDFNFDAIVKIIRSFNLEVSAEGIVGGKAFVLTGAINCEIPLTTAERVWQG
jgi:phosphoribosylformylglycinamidine (FGAM) synthase-like enzyme